MKDPMKSTFCGFYMHLKCVKKFTQNILRYQMHRNSCPPTSKSQQRITIHSWLFVKKQKLLVKPFCGVFEDTDGCFCFGVGITSPVCYCHILVWRKRKRRAWMMKTLWKRKSVHLWMIRKMKTTYPIHRGNVVPCIYTDCSHLDLTLI